MNEQWDAEVERVGQQLEAEWASFEDRTIATLRRLWTHA